MTISQARHLRERFIAIGVNYSLATALSAEVSRCAKESGQEWTVNRLKNLKAGFLKYIAGEAYNLPYIASRKGNLGPIPKGAFGRLWKDCTVTDLKSISLVLNCLMVYSTFVAEVVTPKQWKKFQTSMQRAPVPEEHLREVLDLIRIPKWMKVNQRIALTTLEEFVVTHGFSAKYVANAISQFIDNSTSQALWEEFPQYGVCCNTISKEINTRIGMDDYFGYHTPLDSGTTLDPIGKLGCTQEPGYKLRTYASPNIVHQVAMSRLKRQLFNLLREVNWDCTYDQTRGTDWAKGQLELGREVFSIDLSDATNNFPLELQMKVLREIGCRQEDTSLLLRLSRAPWVSTHEEPKIYRWTVGQPLGLGPSFPAFALTHGLLVQALARRHQVTDCFRVLGDDIIISDGRVASDYLDVMGKLGVPISLDKTLRSRHFAEFAGKVVSRDGILAGVKWKQPSDRSFIDVARLLGPRSCRLFTKRQQIVLHHVGVLLEPQGLGWNPKGIPLDKRVGLTLAFEELAPERMQTYRLYEREWNKIRAKLNEPYFTLQFHVHPEGAFWDNQSGKAGQRSFGPTPVGPWRHLLAISAITGCPVKLPRNECTPTLVQELTRRGYRTLTLPDDPRGVNPLEGLEAKVAYLQPVIRQLGLETLVS